MSNKGKYVSPRKRGLGRPPRTFLINMKRQQGIFFEEVGDRNSFEDLRTDAHISWAGLITLLARDTGNTFPTFFIVRHTEKMLVFSWHPE